MEKEHKIFILTGPLDDNHEGLIKFRDLLNEGWDIINTASNEKMITYILKRYKKI